MDKTVKKPAKDRVKEKAAAVKAKAKAVKGKIKGAAKCAVAFALLLALAGCATSDPASRLTKAEYGDIKVCVDEHARDVTVNITIGDGAIASADSAGSTETMTANPTNDVKPDTNIDVPINKASGAQSVGSVLGDAAAAGIKGLMSKSQVGSDSVKAESDSAATSRQSQTSQSDCPDGICKAPSGDPATCPNGICETGTGNP